QSSPGFVQFRFDLTPLFEIRLDEPEMEHHGQYSHRHDNQAAFLRTKIQLVEHRSHSVSAILRLQVKLQVVVVAPGAVELSAGLTMSNSLSSFTRACFKSSLNLVICARWSDCALPLKDSLLVWKETESALRVSSGGSSSDTTRKQSSAAYRRLTCSFSSLTLSLSCRA